MMRRLFAKRRLFAFAAAMLALAAIMSPRGGRTPVAGACAFVTPPTTYETTEDRALYMTAMELAGYDMLFPRDPFFSQRNIDIGTRANRTSSPDIYVPPTLLKSIAWNESLATMGAAQLPFGAIGPALVSFD